MSKRNNNLGNTGSGKKPRLDNLDLSDSDALAALHENFSEGQRQTKNITPKFFLGKNTIGKARMDGVASQADQNRAGIYERNKNRDGNESEPTGGIGM